MTSIYNTGTVSVPSNSNIVTGTDTYFQSVGNISEGDLFTLDGKEFYEVYQIDTDSQFRIKHRLSGDSYTGDAVSDVSYSIIQSFATDSIAEIAKNVVLLQQNWHRREDEMTGWFNTDSNYYQITNQQGERVLVVTPTGLTKLVDGTIDIGDGSALAELAWANIQNIPETASRWAKYSEITDKPDHAQGWPNFVNVTGKVAVEQLPDNIDTDNKRTQALSPDIDPPSSDVFEMADYPTLKSTDTLPTDSPNNKRLMKFDDVRSLVHISLTDRWVTVGQSLSSRRFAVFYSGLVIDLDSAYSGDITLRVYPMGNGGNGLPNNPTLTNHEWHTVTANVTDLNKIGSFNSQYFIGIIDSITLNGTWETLDTDRAVLTSLGGKFAVDYGTLKSPFFKFNLRSDGYWYSEDITPSVADGMGAGWTQSSSDYKTYTVTNASDTNDALRFFGTGYDNFVMEVILNSSIDNDVAVTISNSDPFIIYYPGVQKFTTTERIFFKRKNGSTPITGDLTIESIKIKVAAGE